MTETGEPRSGPATQEQGGKEFRPTWLIPQEEAFTKFLELERKNEKLFRRIKKINDNIHEDDFTLDELRVERARLEHQTEDGVFGEEGEDQAKPFIDAMRDQIRSLRKDSPSSSEQANLAGLIGKGFSSALQEGKLGPAEQYEELLEIEKWGNRALEINPVMPPAFYVGKPIEERRVIEYRLELSRAVNYKREKGYTMEDLANNNELQGLSKAETAALYRFPGVRKALELYIKIGTNPQEHRVNRDKTGQRQEMITIFEVADKNDVELFREATQARVLDYLVREDKLDPGQAEKLSRDAEQIAFNLLYIGNTWESLATPWTRDRETTKRTFQGKLAAEELLKSPIKTAMSPLDALLDSTTRGEEALVESGAFGLWAATQVRRSIGTQRIGQFDEVVLLKPEELAKDKTWGVEEFGGGKHRLFAPECYPVKLLGSVWEETSIGGKTLMEYLIEGKEIPWDTPEAGGIWGDYLSKIKKCGIVWDYFQGKQQIIFKQFGALSIWQRELLDALGKLKLRTDPEIRRWALYASAGVREEVRRPTIRIGGWQKEVIQQSLGPSVLNYLPKNHIFFPWDRPRTFV